MRISFRLRFHTAFGQSLWLTGNHAILGDGTRLVPLQYLDEQFWQATLVLPGGAVPDVPIAYHYVLRNPDGTVREDWGRTRSFNPAKFAVEEVLLIDSWNSPGFFENVFYTEPFEKVLLKANRTSSHAAPPARTTHTFNVKAPLLAHDQTVCLLGNSPALGNWNAADLVLLGRAEGEDYFTARLDLSSQAFPLAYKYGVYNLAQQTFLRYEEGPNRALYDTVAPHKLTIIDDGFLVLPATTWRGAGVAIPVFSLRTAESFGVGEFNDLKLLADWSKITGLKLIQILPVNDTTATHTWTDSYPYAAISAFALHPVYLNLRNVANGRHSRVLEKLEPERKRLNSLTTVDYEAVLKAKLGFLRAVFADDKGKTFKRKEYRAFFSQNQDWLVPYAAFCCLRDRHGTADFTRWPDHRTYSADDITALASPGSPALVEMEFYYFVQFHLHLQLLEASDYAHSQGVVLKGDIAIGVYRYGADAWQSPELYHLDMQAGAPPDAFAAKGQNWGFPTYNWPRMQENGFAWWKQRFEQMSHYFDAFRVDHILGFFRIWSIPLHAVEGILGYFVPALPVDIHEFSLHGIHFGRDRFTQPYITDSVLAELFGADQDLIRNRFLEPAVHGQYRLRPEFSTQRQVETYFARPAAADLNPVLKTGLFDLISNVVLIEVAGPEGSQYHFRFGVEHTTSFKNLDQDSKTQLWRLYLDYFFHRQDVFWMQQALQKLPALKRVTNMLVCGEDLGMVPACVPEVMKELGLLSLEIQRMPKVIGQDFSRPANAPYLSVVTPSTHDMSTIRGWWEEDRAVTQNFYRRELGRPGEAPQSCEPWINQAIVLQHLASPAMWSIFQLQDLLGIDPLLRRPDPTDERINVPANPKNYWRYRLHLTLEDLLQAASFNDELRRLVQENGRA